MRRTEKILIVEDDEVIHHVLVELLTEPNRELIIVETVAKALEAIEETADLDLVIVDKNLPDGSGMSVAETVTTREPGPEVIVMTAYASIDSAVTAVQLGVYEYLRKPFDDLEHVRRTVHHALDKAHLERDHDRMSRELVDSMGELVKSNERYELAARGANDGLWDWDLVSGKIFFSSRWKVMLGFKDHEIDNVPEEWIDRIAQDDRSRVEVEIKAHFDNKTPFFESEYRILNKNEKYRWVLCRGMAVRDEGGTPVRFAGSQTDITRRKHAEDQLRHAALHDELTTLPNRAVFRDRLDRLIERAKRHPDHMFAVLYLDLDRFKMVNDSLGHSIGDELLVAIAKRLERCVRSGDTVARHGGDEFVLLLDSLGDEDDATMVARRVLEALNRPFNINGQEVYTSASIGIALSGAEVTRAEEFERAADTAMYRAKAAGGGRHELFTREMHDDAVELLYLHTALHRAVDRKEFELHFQPMVNLETKDVVGLEALIRWRHTESGQLISPAQFIPIAEETGLIEPIGAWVLEQACDRLTHWQRRFGVPISISVNLSGNQFREPGLVGAVQDLLEETDLDPATLHLEVTESVILENTEIATGIMEGLKALGVLLYLDDFGTGFSSLSYLHRFPFDYLKIDRVFVSTIESPRHRNIVQGILTLASNIGIGVVAEGVETVEQLEQLRALNCEFGQGYFFARPLDPNAAEAWLETQFAETTARRQRETVEPSSD